MRHLHGRTAWFAFNLIQDVAVLRPLALLCARDLDLDIRLLVSKRFVGRDPGGVWQAEIVDLGKLIGAPVVVFASTADALAAIAGPGVLLLGSESTLIEHRETHQLVRALPPAVTSIVVQHGLECVGLAHNRAHDEAHGATVGFAADFVAVWQPVDRLDALGPGQRDKAVLTGPPAALLASAGADAEQDNNAAGRDQAAIGLVCENLHSVRLRRDPAVQAEFLTALGDFAATRTAAGARLALRPHPAGQYSLRQKVALPDTLQLANGPVHRLDLRRYAYAISAPSSIILDLVLADVPVAIWRDRQDHVDTRRYAGLPLVDDGASWEAFAVAASSDPAPFLAAQRGWLESLGLPANPADVAARFGALIAAAAAGAQAAPLDAAAARERVLVVANVNLPTVKVCIAQPLAAAQGRGEVALALLTEDRLSRRKVRGAPAEAQLRDDLARFAPTVMLMSRYTGPGGAFLRDEARARGAALIYHLDDDLFAVPPELGAGKHAYHNAPSRLRGLADNVAGADLVVCSTEALADRIRARFPDQRIVAGPINASAVPLRAPSWGRPARLGYMASADHAPNLAMVLPAIERLLDTRPHVEFELFGSIPLPDALARFGDRVTTRTAVADYDDFLEALADRRWSIGIAPLVRTHFNLGKSINKWIEYSALGMATVASADTIYDECCADGAGLAVDGSDAWFDALAFLIDNPHEREAIAARAQTRLAARYAPEAHAAQWFDMFALAREGSARQINRSER